MREILFKAKRIDNGEWVEGYLFFIVDTPYIICDGEIMCADGENADLYAKEWYEVEEKTICQYTGLTDKNGNEIWENDICDRKEKYPEVVKQYQGDWVLDYSYVLGKEEGNNYCNLGFYCCERNCVEVIGNVFDNPELIGERA